MLVTCFVDAWCGSLYFGDFYVWVLLCALLKHCFVVLGVCGGVCVVALGMLVA